MKEKIKLEKCPHCGDKPTICSHGGVNCPNCFQFIRMLTPKEMKIHQGNLNKILKMINNGKIPTAKINF